MLGYEVYAGAGIGGWLPMVGFNDQVVVISPASADQTMRVEALPDDRETRLKIIGFTRAPVGAGPPAGAYNKPMPAVRITYPQAGAPRELPFVVGVIADLAGPSGTTPQRLSQSRFVPIDRG